MYRRYKRDVWAWIRGSGITRAEREEVHQEVFLKMEMLIKNRRMPDHVSAMLGAIVSREMSVFRRRLRRRPDLRADGGEVDEQPSDDLDPEQRTSGAQVKGVIEIVLRALPNEDELILRWLHLEDPVTTADVAWLLGCSEPTVRVKHLRAREKFRKVAKRLGYDVDLGGGA